jgi:hypothetical protein
MAALSFNPELHEYRADGLVIPSVTQVLEDCGIVNYDCIPLPVREMAKDRGSKVHIATHLDDENDLSEESVSPGLIPFLMAWRNFRMDTGFTPSLIEYRSLNETYRYAGTLDRTGSFPSTAGGTVLCDIKCNKAEWWVRVQLSAYAAFFQHPRTYRRICVELHADETYKLYEFHSRDWFEDFNVFLAALSVYNAKRKYTGERRQAAA